MSKCAELVYQLKRGELYVGFLTARYPHGEIRGQILPVGTSIAQPCPCNWPWKNHGEYVKSVQSVAARFVQEGRITVQQRAAVVKQAANSGCGKVR